MSSRSGATVENLSILEGHGTSQESTECRRVWGPRVRVGCNGDDLSNSNSPASRDSPVIHLSAVRLLFPREHRPLTYTLLPYFCGFHGFHMQDVHCAGRRTCNTPARHPQGMLMVSAPAQARSRKTWGHLPSAWAGKRSATVSAAWQCKPAAQCGWAVCLAFDPAELQDDMPGGHTAGGLA